jgi:hypothetical protein
MAASVVAPALHPSGPEPPRESALVCDQEGDDAGIHAGIDAGEERGGEDTASDGPAPNDKPRVDAGLCETLLDYATKRVMRFELTTFTLAT